MEKNLLIAAVTFGHMPTQLPAFVSSVVNQTRTEDDWELMVAHDGTELEKDDEIAATSARETSEYLCSMQDKHGSRIQHQYKSPRANQYGHNLRELMLQECEAKYINFQNADNQLFPVFVQELLQPALDYDFDFVMCNLVHNYALGKHYGALDSYPQTNFIDMANFIVKTEIAQKVGFAWRDFAADGMFVEALMKEIPQNKKYKIDKYLMVHN